jgi:hypothetical protein
MQRQVAEKRPMMRCGLPADSSSLTLDVRRKPLAICGSRFEWGFMTGSNKIDRLDEAGAQGSESVRGVRLEALMSLAAYVHRRIVMGHTSRVRAGGHPVVGRNEPESSPTRHILRGG